jgi:hypothetical protein
MSTLAEQVAVELLRDDGIEVVWELHLIATDAHRRGHYEAANGLMEVAGAAEEICFRAIEKLDRDREPAASRHRALI